jgi:hypothetical protein
MSLLRDLANALEMPVEDISRIIATAPRRYKIFAIPKRSGVGHRIIAQPARELKAIQRYVISEKLRELRVHSIATAYKVGKNIADNAAPHADKRAIMKLDFRDFFHSITPNDLQSIIRRSAPERFALEDRALLTSILFWRNPVTNRLCLSIGAPSSPHVSNIVMEPLDREFYEIARECSATCTRYADDITVSANSIENLLKAEVRIRRAVSQSRQPKLVFNEDKRGIFTTAGRRIVTGLVLTPDAKISLGRDRKRTISAALHHISVGRNVTPEHRQRTRGWLAYAKSVEPTFFQRMSRKYPNAFLSVISMPLVPSISPADDL